MSLRDVLDDRWQALDDHRPTAGFRLSAVPVDTPNGPLSVALDGTGSRHLLVPLAPRQRLASDLRGRAVHLVERRLEDEHRFGRYADLVLVDDTLSDVFTSLCEDVLLAVAREPGRAVRGLKVVLDSWRSLLAGATGPLTSEALAGLFGELTVLERLARLEPGIARTWCGPTGAAQDFLHGASAIEVKSTTTQGGRSVRINGVDQLDPPVGGTLTLVWLRLACDTDDGRTTPELVDEVLRLVDEPMVVRRGLAEIGYLEADRRLYADRRFVVREQLCFAVTSGFPRVTRSGLVGDARLAGVSDVTYQVDLDSAPARAAQIDDYIGAFTDDGR